MGKRIISQARGRGGPTYTVRKRAFIYKIGYPSLEIKGEATLLKLIKSGAHSAPIAKFRIGDEIFYNPAAQGNYEGQKIGLGQDKIENGNIVELKNIPVGTRIFNIEIRPGDGGKMTRTGGSFATVENVVKEKNKVIVLMNHKKQIELNENCKATIGMVAGQGRLTKPLVKAGKKHHLMQVKGKKWHNTSAVKVNAVDHPFGGGRGKRIKSKIAKRNAPAGRRVGHIAPRQTGKR